MTNDQFSGCLLGLAIGDALGAPYEGGPLERLVWRLIGRTSDGRLRWTDDTQMTLDLAESLLEENGICPDSLAMRFAKSYRWSRGYGAGAARVLKRIRGGQPWASASKAVYAEGSYGNGAAMRAPVLALFFPRDGDEITDAARLSAAVTHAHPSGIDGAILMAVAAKQLLNGQSASETLTAVQAATSTPEMTDRLSLVADWIKEGQTRSPGDTASKLGNGITAPTSCPTALYIALRYRQSPFEEMMDFVIRCRGDVDTIGAMAGALWGIANGAQRLPNVNLESRELIVELASKLYQRFDSRFAGQSSLT